MVFCLIAPVALLVGCGNEGSSKESQGAYDVEASTTMAVAKPPLSKAQFVYRINKICRQVWPIVYSNWKEYTAGQGRKLSERERFEDAVRVSLLAGIVLYIFDNVRQTGAPAGEEGEIEKIIGPFQAAVELGWKERWRAHSIADILPHFVTYTQRARRYGLDDCLVDQTHLQPIEDSSPAK